MERCSDSDDTFRVCDLWVAPHTLTAVAFPPDVTYIRIEQCVLTPSSESGARGDDAESGECLESVIPEEYYGTPLLWPSSVDVGYAAATLCEKVTNTVAGRKTANVTHLDRYSLSPQCPDKKSSDEAAVLSMQHFHHPPTFRLGPCLEHVSP